MTGARSIFDDETLAEISRHLRDPHPIGIPSATDRAFWEGIADHAVVTALLAQARLLHGTPWPHVPARGYLRYARDGNRIIHEQHIRARQERLTLATIAAAVTDGAEWYDEVADGGNGGEDSEEPDDDNEDPVGDTDADDSAGDTDGNEGPSTSDDLDDIPNTGANIGTLALLATLIAAAGAALLIRNRATR